MNVHISHQPSDPAWDAFLDRAPRSHYIQSSMWAQVVAQSGWRCVRLTVTQNEDIVAGFQMLLRSIPIFGTMGYIPRGPVIASGDADVVELVTRHVHEVARSERILFLKLQPAYGDDGLVERLLKEGFHPSHAHADNVATVLIDLTQDKDTLLKKMKKSLRRGIRRAGRKGAIARQSQGTAQDLSLFYHILRQTSQRGEFAIHSEAYYQKVWECFAPRGHATLFFVECESEPVATVFVIGFGNSVFARFGGWNGRYGNYEPNALLRWTAIQWAKEQGYRWYDFMGIDETVARTLLQNHPAPDSGKTSGYTLFKLGFGGQIVLSPGAYDYVYNPLLAQSFRWLSANRGLYDRLLNLVRVG